MDPAAFLARTATRHLPPDTHTKHVTRSSLGETTTPGPRNLAVNLPIDRD